MSLDRFRGYGVRSSMRITVILLLLLGLLVVESACVRSGQPSPRKRLTGTCDGVCNYYAACKTARGKPVSDRTTAVCRSECKFVFSSPYTRLAYESLRCEDAITFIEGSGGRAPGEPVSETAGHR